MLFSFSISLLGTLHAISAMIDWTIGFLPANGRLCLWGSAAGIVSMLLYRRMSAQDRLDELKTLADESKAQLQSLDASSPEYRNAAWQSMKYSAQRLRVALWPAFVSSIPVLLIASFLSTAYGYRQPLPHHPAALLLDEGASTDSILVENGQRMANGWLFLWPAEQETITVRNQAGQSIYEIQSKTRPGTARTFGVSSLVMGSPAGRIKGRGDVQKLEVFTTPPDLVLPNNVTPYQWMAPFFAAVVISSLVLKLKLGIK